MHTHKAYSYEHLQRTKPTDLVIHKITTDASRSTETSSATKTLTPSNPGINPVNGSSSRLSRGAHVNFISIVEQEIRQITFMHSKTPAPQYVTTSPD